MAANNALLCFLVTIIAVDCYDNSMYQPNDNAPRNPFLTYDSNNRPVLDQYSSFSQSRSADVPLKRNGPVPRTSDGGFVLPPGDVPASFKSKTQQQVKPVAVVSKTFDSTKTYESAANWPTPPPIGGLPDTGASNQLTPAGKPDSAAASVNADSSLASLKTADEVNAQPAAAPSQNSQSPLGLSKAGDVGKLDDGGFILPPPIPLDDGGSDKLLSLKPQSESNADHAIVLKKFQHGGHDDVQNLAVADSAPEQQNDAASGSAASGHPASDQQLFGRLLTNNNQDRFANLNNEFLKRRRRRDVLPPSNIPSIPRSDTVPAPSNFPSSNVASPNVANPSSNFANPSSNFANPSPNVPGKIYLPQDLPSGSRRLAPNQPINNQVQPNQAGRVELISTTVAPKTKRTKKPKPPKPTKRPKANKNKYTNPPNNNVVNNNPPVQQGPIYQDPHAAGKIYLPRDLPQSG